uniref:Uncharacterized protein n=1 Tax=Oreochromis niloticus TaxID=8128 RepID=A0A669E0W6_ORENI
MPGILPTHLTTILSMLFPIRTLTALLMVMLSRLTPFTSTSLLPTVSPASAADTLFLKWGCPPPFVISLQAGV